MGSRLAAEKALSHTKKMRRFRSITRTFSLWGAAFAAVALSSATCHAGGPASKPAAGVEDDELLVGRADAYSQVVDRAVGLLVRGDADGFRAMLSEATIESETRGTGAIDSIIKSRFIPFFSDFARLTDTVATLPTHDAGNNPGLAICRTFETNSGQERPFVMYVINQRGNYVLGNLILDKTFEDLRAEAR